MNYSCFVNKYRVDEAKHLLYDKRYIDKNIEEISTMVGFTNRQSFYAAFHQFVGITPKEHRDKHREQ